VPDRARAAVLFVCLGNICRSPTAQGVFETLLEKSGYQGRVDVDSCGTGDWHVGKPPDPRSVSEAAARGYELGRLRARQLHVSDFHRFDYILAMDRANLATLRALCPDDFPGHLGLLLDLLPGGGGREVPDPYYGGSGGFATVLDLVEAASEALLAELQRRGFIAHGSA